MPPVHAVSIQAPATGSIVSPGSRAVITDVSRPGSDPAREFHYAINGVNVATVIGGTVTYVNPAYSCAITAPSSGVERITLTRLSDWPNPYELDIEAAFRNTPSGSINYANSRCVVATYSFQATAPYPGQPDVTPQSDVALSFSSTATLVNAALNIAGVQAVQFSSPNTVVWNTPDFDGKLVVAGQSISVVANPRRNFDYEQLVEIDLALTLSAGGTVHVNNSFLYQFHIRPETTALFNPALRFTRLDRPFQNAAASETLRYILRGALLPRPSSPSFEAALYFQIVRSSLGTVAQQFQRPDLAAEVDRFVPGDIPDVMAIDAALTEAALLWESVLLEASEVGLAKDLLQLIARTYEAPYPQERVGAACAIIFAQAPLRP